MSRPRMPGNVKAKLSIDSKSYAEFKAALKALERAVRKEIIEKALRAGGTIIYTDADAKAPGPGVVMEIVGGRSLRKRVDPKFANVIKSNGKFAAIGPDKKHWHYRFSEFGARPHDIKARKSGMIVFEGKDGLVFVRAAKRTGGVPKRPFLRPAVDKNKDAAVRAMADVLKREIDAAGK
jgi:HK97 gp10 family phage protein